MVFGVAGGVHGDEDAVGSDGDLLPVIEHMQALGRGRIDATVEGVEQWAVDTRSRVDQLRRVSQVPGAFLVHVHRGGRKGARHIADATRVVEVDVGDGHPRQLGRTHSDLVQRGQEDRDRALTARLDEHRSGAFDEIAGGDPLPPPEHGVDLEDARRDRARRWYGGNRVATLGVVEVEADIGVAVGMAAVRVRPAHRGTALTPCSPR